MKIKFFFFIMILNLSVQANEMKKLSDSKALKTIFKQIQNGLEANGEFRFNEGEFLNDGICKKVKTALAWLEIVKLSKFAPKNSISKLTYIKAKQDFFKTVVGKELYSCEDNYAVPYYEVRTISYKTLAPKGLKFTLELALEH